MIDIDKIDSGTWTVSADEEIVFRCRKNVKCVFELAMIFENDKKWLLNEENLDQAKKERINRLRWHFP